MKKYIALLLAGLMITMAACSSGEAEETAAETEAPAETAAETASPETVPEEEETEAKVERPENETVIQYNTLELEKDAVYDRTSGLLVLYFTNHELVYPEDTKCSVGLISDEEAFSITGTPDTAAYPDMQTSEDEFNGIAIKLSEDIPAGEYFASITFDEYIVSFDFTAQ